MKPMFYLTAIAICSLVIHLSAPADILDGLVAFWTFDEGKGKMARDSIGEHHGEIDGATWTDDAMEGTALDFSPKKDSSVIIEHIEDIDELPDGFTIAHWAKQRGRGAMMDKSDNDGARIQWFLLDDTRLHWGIGNTFGFAPGLGQVGKWIYLTWSHEPGDSKVYLNGEKVGGGPDGPVPVTGRPMYFGTRMPWQQFGKEQRFDGILDEVAFWTRPLSVKEIEEITEQGIQSILAVSPEAKLATAWASLKTRP